jgi:hypothetical protein
MSSITHKIDKINNIPADSFPCIITLRNEITLDISDDFTEQSVYEHEPYVDEGIIAVTDASVIGKRHMGSNCDHKKWKRTLQESRTHD